MNRRNVKWIVLGIAVVFAGAAFLLSKEPEPPFSVLKKYPIVDRKVAIGRDRLVVLKGNYEDVERDLALDLGSAVMVGGTPSSEPSMLSGQGLRYTLFGSRKWGPVTLSEAISAPNPVQEDGFVVWAPGHEIRKGFCSITYTPKPSLFNRFLTWTKGFFGDEKPRQSVTVNERP